MEVYFLDVGQGTSQLILLGGGEAIIIDAGPQSDDILLKALHRYSVDRIQRFVLSHSHGDHTAAASRVLTTYGEQIEQLWFVYDSALSNSKFYKRLQQMLNNKTFSKQQLNRLERDASPRVIYSNELRGIRLSVISPSFGTNLDSLGSSNVNATSAVLVLDIHDSRIVFAADSTIQQWREYHSAAKKPLHCDILAVPHHGGDMGQSSDEDFQWLYSEALLPKQGVISVGTRGGHGHPKSVVIDTLCESGTTVLCTQITQQCCSELEEVRGGMLYPLEAIRQSATNESRTQAGNSRRVACAGTVVADVNEEGCEIRYLASHQQSIDELALETLGTPLCRNCGSKSAT